jgi:hypothetical protein
LEQIGKGNARSARFQATTLVAASVHVRIDTIKAGFAGKLLFKVF